MCTLPQLVGPIAMGRMPSVRFLIPHLMHVCSLAFLSLPTMPVVSS